jgi:steroid delta-isomerase-like uncharacterized protein
MPADENIALAKRWFEEVWNQGRVQTIYDLMAEDGVASGQDQPGVIIQGPAAFEAFYQKIRGAFPDIKIVAEDVFASGDKVCIRWRADMTHTGDQLGFAPTNKRARVTGISVMRFANGKIAEGWDNWDQLSLMQQLSTTAAATN